MHEICSHCTVLLHGIIYTFSGEIPSDLTWVLGVEVVGQPHHCAYKQCMREAHDL